MRGREGEERKKGGGGEEGREKRGGRERGGRRGVGEAETTLMTPSGPQIGLLDGSDNRLFGMTARWMSNSKR